MSKTKVKRAPRGSSHGLLLTSFQMQPESWERFKAICRIDGTSAATRLREMINAVVKARELEK